MRQVSKPRLVLLVVLSGLPAVWAQATGSSVILDTPTTGRFAPVQEALAEALAGTDLTPALRSDKGALADPAVVMTYSGNVPDAAWMKTVGNFLRAGGGVVYVVGSTRRHVEPTTDFIKDFGLSFEIKRTPRAAVELLAHPLTEGVSELPLVSCNTDLTGAGRGGVMIQGASVVGAAVSAGKGRLVLIPAEMVTPRGGDSLSPGQKRLLGNACVWAAGAAPSSEPVAPTPVPDTEATPEPDDPDAEAVPVPDESDGEDAPEYKQIQDTRPRPMRTVLQRDRVAPGSDFGGAILVDILAGDDNWQYITETLEEALKGSRLRLRYLDPGDTVSPLVEALASQPALAVIGSTRQFTVDEAIAVKHYVTLGGSVLFVCHAMPVYVIRLIDMNTLLREFSISVSLIRPAGASVLEKHPITEDIPLPPRMYWGTDIWSPRATPVAKAGSRPYLSCLEQDAGRLVVVDGKTLMVGTRVLRSPVPGESGQPFAPLVSAAVGWLLETGAR